MTCFHRRHLLDHLAEPLDSRPEDTVPERLPQLDLRQRQLKPFLVDANSALDDVGVGRLLRHHAPHGGEHAHRGQHSEKGREVNGRHPYTLKLVIRRTKTLPTRRTMLARAAGVALPSFISRITRDSSSEIGGEALLATASIACGSDNPAFIALESRLTVSGRRALNALSLRV